MTARRTNSTHPSQPLVGFGGQWVTACAGLGLALAVAVGCGGKSVNGTSDGNTSWLGACSLDEACTSGLCTAGACAASCTGDGDCASHEGAHCAMADDTCAFTPTSLCAPSCEDDSDCSGIGTNYACRLGACIPVCDAEPDGNDDGNDGGDDDAVVQPEVPDASAPLPAVPPVEEPSASIDAGSSSGGASALDPEPASEVGPTPLTDAAAPQPQPNSGDGSTEPPIVDDLPWGPPTPVEDYGGQVSGPKVTTDAAGNAIAVWRRFDDSVPQQAAISANRYAANEGWGEDVPVFEVTSNYLGDPCIAGNADGAVVAAWTTSSSADVSSVYAVWAVVYSPTSGWSEATQVGPSSGPATSVECVLDEAGNAAVVWSQSDESTTALYAAHFAAGASWAPFEPIGASTNVGSISLAMNAGGDAVLAWNDWATDVPTMWSMGYSPSDGWQEPLPIPASTERTSYYVDVALSTDGQAVVVWSEHSIDGLQHQIWASHQLSSAEWGSPEQLDDGLQINSLPVVGIDAAGNALAAWEGFSEATTQNDLRVNRYSPEGGWEGPTLLAADGTQVNLSMRPTGVAVATWRAPYEYTMDGDIAAASYSVEAGWSEATPFSDDDAGNSTVPHVSVNDTGVTTVVWLNQDSAGSDIWSNRRE